MERLQEILKSNAKYKDKIALIVTLSKKDPKMIREIIRLLDSGTDVDRGTCAEVLKLISKTSPKMVVKYMDVLIRYINYNAPRVKWGVPETIGNLAKDYPDSAAKAIPKLLGNTEDESTVVRWCAGYALTEIVKNNPSTRKKMIPIFDELIAKEENNGVRNLYLKALKTINN